MRVSKQLKTRLLTSAVALAFSTLPMLTSASQAQDYGFQTTAGATASTYSGITSGQSHLLAARQALAVGDVKGATESVLRARASQTDFSGVGDSPTKLDGMIAKQNQLVELFQTGSVESGYDTAAAKFLMEQAEALVKYRDFNTARVLAEQANQFTAVDFSTFAMTPNRMIQIIDLADQGATTQGTPSAATSQLATAKTEVSRLMAQAQLAVDQNNWTQAKQFVTQAKSYNLGDEQFAKGETLPWQLDMTIDNALSLQNSSVRPAVASPPVFASLSDGPVARAKYDPATDATKVVPASLEENQLREPIPNSFNPALPPIPGPNAVVAKLQDSTQPNRGQQMYRSGVEAMQSNDTARAREFFQLAMQYPADLDAPTQNTIRNQLTRMDQSAAIFEQQPPVSQTSAVDEEFGYGLRNKSNFTKLQSEVFRERQAAERMLQDEPREALQRLAMLRTKVASAQVAAETSRPLLKMVDRDITKFQDYIDNNIDQIKSQEELAERRGNVERTRQRRLDVDQQLNQLVNEYNKLLDEQRFAEAEMVVRQARDLAPGTEIVAVLEEKHRTVAVQHRYDELKRNRENNWLDLQENLYRDALGMNIDDPLKFADPEAYAEKARNRAESLAAKRYSSDANRMIWNKLKNTDVEGDYQGTLAEAMDQLSRQAGLNIVFDTLALQGVNVSIDQPVSAPIRNPISLESALNVILSGVGLEFTVENEVIKITSKDAQEAALVQEVYYIGDLLAPLKNYRDPNQLTFNAAGGNNGYGNFGGGSLNVANAGPSTLAGAASQAALAQQLGAGGFPGANTGGFGAFNGSGNGPQTGTPVFGTVGQQPQGGITQADFQTLIQLIQQTVSSDSWEQNGGGNGTIQSFPPNLSLIVANSQKVQDEIRDLLKKLRELNDVQIVIEVRFVAIQDDFFERIGIDFDFSLNDNSGVADPTVDVLPQSTVVGNTGSALGDAVFTPTLNQDIQFTQGSFGVAEPAFGGFSAASAANFGFAILSDIEVFFLIQAAKGSTRATVTEAPTVVMFNGQSASVNDTQNQPFVTSVTPVVGDFAVAHQPLITILPDGTNLNVTATVSADRRSVNMALVPFFSEIVEVQTFTFAGTTTTEVSTNSLLDDLLGNLDPTGASDIDSIETVSEGVTIQLPVLATTSVNTVVSVPDGGTILMGGIKRMRENRTEAGVPLLSSIPYINRLFTNVGTSRETTNLMMMVTPRIIIQAEEEQKQIGVFGDEQ